MHAAGRTHLVWQRTIGIGRATGLDLGAEARMQGLWAGVRGVVVYQITA